MDCPFLKGGHGEAVPSSLLSFMQVRQPSVAAPGCMFTQELQVSPLMLPDAVPDSETVQGRTMLDELKGVVQEGFACVKLRKRSKAPVDPDWTSAPIPSYSQVRKWWESGFNIGVRLGKPSKLSDGLYLHVIDVDIRDPDDPEGAFEEAAAKLRELFIGVNWKRLSDGPIRLRREVTARLLLDTEAFPLTEDRPERGDGFYRRQEVSPLGD